MLHADKNQRREGRNIDHTRTESNPKDSKLTHSKLNEEYYHQIQKLLKATPNKIKPQTKKSEDKPSLYNTQKIVFKNSSPERKLDDSEPMKSYMDSTIQIKPKSKKQYYNEKTISENLGHHQDHHSLMSTDSLRIPKSVPKTHMRNQTMESTNRDLKCLALKKIVQQKESGQSNKKSRSNAHALQMSDYFRCLINQKAKKNSNKQNSQIKGKIRHRNNFSNILSSSTLQKNNPKKIQNFM